MPMTMPLVQRIAQQAIKTFRKPLSPETFSEELQKLKQLIHRCRAEDLCLPLDELKPEEEFRFGRSMTPGSRSAPVGFIHVCEVAPAFSMSMFIVRRGATLPLHDHPRMHGLVKLLYGKVLIRSYTVDKERLQRDDPQGPGLGGSRPPIPVSQEPDRVCTPADEPVHLTPDHANFHEIASVDGPAAFVDVLAPPYAASDLAEGPHCHYYRVTHSSSDKKFLEEVPCTTEYWCDQILYEGPWMST